MVVDAPSSDYAQGSVCRNHLFMFSRLPLPLLLQYGLVSKSSPARPNAVQPNAIQSNPFVSFPIACALSGGRPILSDASMWRWRALLILSREDPQLAHVSRTCVCVHGYVCGRGTVRGPKVATHAATRLRISNPVCRRRRPSWRCLP